MNRKISKLLVLALATSMLFVLPSKGNDVSDGFPVADFTFEVDGYNVTFNASMSYDSDGFIVNYTWDFGDGSIGYGEVTEHEYAEEGIYEVWLTVTDNESKTNSTFKAVCIDLTPPSTEYQLLPPSPTGKNGWYVSKVKIELIAYDELSGVKHTYYSINDDEWTEYTGAIYLEEDGNYTIKYYSIDNYLNQEEEKSFGIKLDMERPYTICNISQSSYDGWYDDILLVSLEAYDNLSGVENLYYRIDGGSYEKYVENLTVYEGRHVLEYFAMDKAGNAERLNRREINIDMTPPEVTLSPHKGFYIFGRKIISSDITLIIGNITIVAECSDNLAGIKEVEFYIDGVYKANSSSPPYEWLWDEFSLGSHEIKVIVYDKAGNKAIKTEDVVAINPKWI